jgi:hypothetical protein
VEIVTGTEHFRVARTLFAFKRTSGCLRRLLRKSGKCRGDPDQLRSEPPSFKSSMKEPRSGVKLAAYGCCTDPVMLNIHYRTISLWLIAHA